MTQFIKPKNNIKLHNSLSPFPKLASNSIYINLERFSTTTPSSIISTYKRYLFKHINLNFS